MANIWGDPSDWGWRRVVVWIVAFAAIALAGWSVFDLSLRSLRWYSWVYGSWVIGPPIWFFFEYHFVFSRKDDRLEQFKYAQDLAQKFWAALLVLLAGIGYFQWHLSLSSK